jgi:hydroxyacylglutathione hydrolase
MILKRFYDEPLAQASFLVGCQATGEAIVIDPNRDVDQYIAAAAAEELRITAVTETHIHADFVSGARELSERTGATMYLSDAGPDEWRYRFRADPRVVPVSGGEKIRIGNVIITPVHTPGHTPEHLSFFVTDGAASTEPMGLMTGDFVFVGDVGRPDLLEKAAHVSGASDAAARQLFRSLTWFKSLPDHLQVWPGHGAGSSCGKGIGAVPQSTVGYERRTNWGLGIDDEEEFVRQVLQGQPEPPAYFGVMKRINREGPALLGRLPAPERIGERRLEEILAGGRADRPPLQPPLPVGGAVVVDTRSTAAYAGGHIPGTLNLPLGRSFTTYAGSLLPYDADCYLIVDPRQLEFAVRALVSIGLDRIAGYAGLEVVELWAGNGRPLGTIQQVTAAELAAAEPETVVVDVRGESEWRSGHLPGARLVPLPELPSRVAEIPADRRVVLVCQTGSRSAVAASFLRARGIREVSNVAGGVAAWFAAGLPVER